MDKTQEVRRLREQGDTIREISLKTGVPRATVHRIIKSTPLEIDEVFDQLGQMLTIRLPVTFLCPKCGKEEQYVALCPLCGKFVTLECETPECRMVEFDLSTVKLNMPTPMKQIYEKFGLKCH